MNGRKRLIWIAWGCFSLATIGCSKTRSTESHHPVPSDPSTTSPSSSAPYVRVLGSVQDGGLPHAACNCDRCERARQDPDARRYVASIALVVPSSGKVFLFDATPDLHHQLFLLRDVRNAPPGRVDRSPVDGVFLTHAHIGHYLGLAFFGYEVVSTSGLPVYATPRMADFLRHNGPWSQLVALSNIAIEEMAAGSRVELDESIVVEAIAAPHRDEYADTLGFVIRGPNRSLLYLPDTDSWTAWSVPIETFLADVDVALIDGTFFSLDELPGRSVEEIGHPLISDSMDLLQGLVDDRATEIFFTHLNHSNPALDPDSAQIKEVERRGFAIVTEMDRFPL